MVVPLLEYLLRGSFCGAEHEVAVITSLYDRAAVMVLNCWHIMHERSLPCEHCSIVIYTLKCLAAVYFCVLCCLLI